MKKIACFVIGTAAACLVNAPFASEENYKGYKGENLIELTVPNFIGGIEVGIEWLYLRPSSNNLFYAASDIDTPGSIPGSENESIDIESEENIPTSYDSGFQLLLGYKFANTGNDIQLRWFHLNTDLDDDVSYSGPNNDIETVSSNTANNNTWVLDRNSDHVSASAEANYRLDVIDLDFGQYINITPRLQTRIAGGLRYAHIRNDLDFSYQGIFSDILADEINTPFVEYDDSDSDFNGIGPMFKIDATYAIKWGLGVKGSFDAALLVGELELDQNLSRTSRDTLLINNYDIDYEDINVVAPAFDARLAATYNYPMAKGWQINAEVGYQVSQYFNVIEEGFFDDSVPTVKTDLNLNGPYVSVVLKV